MGGKTSYFLAKSIFVHTMWSPPSNKKLMKVENHPLPDLAGSPVSSASSCTESPPLSPLDTTFGETIEKSEEVRPNGGYHRSASSTMYDFINLFPNPCQALMSPWIRVFDIDDTKDQECHLLAEHRVPRYREMRVQYLGDDHFSPTQRRSLTPEPIPQLHSKKRRAGSNIETRRSSIHPLEFIHHSQQTVSVCACQD
jgi:hypothetical protein